MHGGEKFKYSHLHTILSYLKKRRGVRMVSENQSENQSQPRPIKVSFPGRRTGMGAYTQYRVFSLKKKAEIKPHRTERSRTGNHWTDIWFLLPGKYFIVWRDISNSGKHYCNYGCLIVVGTPFVMLKNGELITGKELDADYYFVKIDGRSYKRDDVTAYSRHGYAIVEWKGDVPEFAKETLCECIFPKEFAD